MSGVTGADRIKSRQDFQLFLKSYDQLLKGFPGYQGIEPSGSYNSDPSKNDFGDIDLITHIKSDQDKATVKKELAAYLTAQPETVIVPFSSPKYAGRRHYNSGEIISVRYHDPDAGYSAQVDNIIALSPVEAQFKKSFLDFPAEAQGLILGLVKVATLETDPAVLLNSMGIPPVELGADQELEFNLSSVELQLRRVTYEPGTYKQAKREVLWSSNNFADLQKLLYQYDITAPFEQLLAQTKATLKNPRSAKRIAGVFSSMISIKSGEVGTPKGANKQRALDKIAATFGEGRVRLGHMIDSMFRDKHRL